ncbi:hypothetical protein J2129_001303 [Methanofollis sp. W23]|nr:hypothetical protein [Methanofollis sp. W23]
MILTILSSGLHESVNSPYLVEANTQRRENSSDGSAALNSRDFPAISRRGPPPDPQDEERWERRWNTIPIGSPLSKKSDQATKNFHPVCVSQRFMLDST